MGRVFETIPFCGRILETQLVLMRHLKEPLLFLFFVFSLCSCASIDKVLGKSHTEYGKVKFFAVSTSDVKASISKIYADVDSNGVKKYYSFYPDRIVMTDESAKELSFTVLFQRLPDNYDSNIHRPLSPLDTLVLSQAKTFLNSTKYSHLKYPKGYTGFQIEVNYLHGFPKGRKFRPL
jgi:hypothetical protein